MLNIYFTSPPDDVTRTLTIEYYAGQDQEEVLILSRRLKKIGFESQAVTGTGIRCLTFTKPGSTRTGGWTLAEKKKNMKAARKLLAECGYVNIQHYKLMYQ